MPRRCDWSRMQSGTKADRGNLMNFGKLICLLPKWLGGGCLRGEVIGSVKAEGKPEERTYQCPRCHGNIHTRKIKAKAKEAAL